jgi:heme/copper-type cytochrome/quinol oxidase subunit 2
MPKPMKLIQNCLSRKLFRIAWPFFLALACCAHKHKRHLVSAERANTMVRNILAQRPMGKPKVLLLGISYPSVEVQMEKHGFDKDVLVNKEGSVEQAVECVKRGILTEMDARDLARCVATEHACGVDAYTVSKEIGAMYRNDRHAYGDFNGRNFCKSLRDAFGEDVQFSQIILDYYWMPSGW